MATTIYATFNTERDAERAAGALMDHGINAADVSFIVPEGRQAVNIAYEDAYAPIGSYVGTHIGTHYNTPTSAQSNRPPADIPVPDPATPGVPVLSPELGHPNIGGPAPTEVAPGPGFHYDASGGIPVDPIPVNPPSLYSTTAATPTQTVPETTVSEIPSHGSRLPTVAGNISMDQIEADHNPHIVDNRRELPHAARGITTTTGEDATKGAIEGAGWGVGLGDLLGLAAVAIPGVGLVAGAGALIASLTAATAAAGAVAGGAYGFLHDMGLPPHVVSHLEEHLKTGSPILSIGITPEVQESEIITLLEKYGATSAQVF